MLWLLSKRNKKQEEAFKKALLTLPCLPEGAVGLLTTTVSQVVQYQYKE